VGFRHRPVGGRRLSLSSLALDSVAFYGTVGVMLWLMLGASPKNGSRARKRVFPALVIGVIVTGHLGWIGIAIGILLGVFASFAAAWHFLALERDKDGSSRAAEHDWPRGCFRREICQSGGVKAILDVPDEIYQQVESMAARRGESVNALVSAVLNAMVASSIEPAFVKSSFDDPSGSELTGEERLKKWREEEAEFLKLMSGPDLDPRSAVEIIREGRR
jgi:plasmid stability protein